MLLRHEGFRRLCRARDLLRELGEPAPSIADLAREVRISPFHFMRQFEAVFGVTPHQFRIHARLDAAKQLLATGQYSVTDVCMEVGFSSLGSFSALFTRRIGETPSAYRRRVRAMVSVPGASILPGVSGVPSVSGVPGAGGVPGVLPVDLTPGCLSLMTRLPASAFAASFRSFREARAAQL
jgi:AraC-like DNA-binding protein